MSVTTFSGPGTALTVPAPADNPLEVDDMAKAIPPDRFFAKVEWSDHRHDGTRCLVWTGAVNYGYGVFGVKRGSRWKNVRAHRWLYERWVGPIPKGLVIDHLCRNRACVNPAHLEPVTQRENVRRGEPANRTHCPHGHPYDEENTYHPPSGRRQCIACSVARRRRYPKDARRCATPGCGTSSLDVRRRVLPGLGTVPLCAACRVDRLTGEKETPP